MTTHRRPDSRVSVVLVSHDGASWLGPVLDAVGAQTRPADHVVAVDTGSADTSPALLTGRLGAGNVVTASRDTGFGRAVELGLDALPEGGDDDWVWLLHDDSAPAPDALEQLLAVTATEPSADIVGPKLREWPSLRRLLEVGVTLSGTGRRETGLEPGEYDQGQHDRVRDVLAVHTAGMLVRRPVITALGLDPRLPLFGNDLDLGWRAARAGHRCLVAPQAVVFHVEAAHRGLRGTHHPRRGERAAALFTLLANSPAVSLPLRALRLLVGGLLRALGLLLVRAPGEAWDELVALATTYGRPGRLLAARRSRRRAATVRHREVRHLLAPWWLPYRHGLDAVTAAAGAVAVEAGDAVTARRSRQATEAATDTGPVPLEAQSLSDDSGVVSRLASSPAAWVLLALLVASAAAARGLLGAGSLSGGALLPAPEGPLDWWRGYLSSRHDLGTGSTAPAPAYLLPLAVGGSLLLGSASLLVDVLFLLAVPLAAWGAHRFLRRVTGSRTAALWGALAYAVLPVVGGAVEQGRLGTVAGLLVLPWLAHAAVPVRTGATPDRRARAVWRTALLLALLTAFVPVAWGVAAVLGVVAVLAAPRDRLALARGVLLVLTGALVLLLPWSAAVWSHQGAASLLTEAGLPAPELLGTLDRWDLALGRPGGGAPAWLSAGVLVAALAAPARSDTRRPVLAAWTVVVTALAGAALLSSVTVTTAADAGPHRVWVGFLLLLAQAAGICAAALAATGIRGRLRGASFTWRQPVGALVVVLAVLTPVLSLGWWVSVGEAGPVDRGEATDIPAYISDAAHDDPAQGVLVVRGSVERGFRYLLLRGPGLRLGDDAVLPRRSDQTALTTRVADLAGAPQPEDVRALARDGVGFVYAPAPTDSTLVSNLDSLSGLDRGSASARGDRAWQLEPTPSDAVLRRPGDPWRPWLLTAQGVAVVAALVLAAPSWRRRR